jgi:hypothetical protein
MKLTELPGQRLRESRESQMKAGRYNPAWTYHFFFREINRRIVLPVGDSDDWFILTDGWDVYCVSWNRSLDYCGVTLYLAEGRRDMQEGGSLFFQSEEQYQEVLGKRGLDLTNRTICRRLIETLNECCY